jgi:hypothetical protein
MKSLGLVCLLAFSTSVWAHPARPPDLDRVPPPPPPQPEEVIPAGEMIDQRAELTDAGDAVRIVMTSGGKKPGIKLVSKSGSLELSKLEGVGTLKTAHGTTLVAISVDDEKEPFRVALFDGKKLSKVQKLARPKKMSNFPFAIAATRTPDGFTVFFQEVETANPNEAHTYMVTLDKAGAVDGELREVQIPWALAAAAWNGTGYHLGLIYSGGGGAQLSMVSTTADGSPQQHPDWATQPGSIDEVHLVVTGERIRAVYRGTGGRLMETDVTKIGQWGQVSNKAKDLGAIAATEAIAITAKGTATKIKAK